MSAAQTPEECKTSDAASYISELKKIKEEIETTVKEAKETIEEMKRVKEEAMKAKAETEKATADAKAVKEELEKEKEAGGGGGENDKVIINVGTASSNRQHAMGAYFGTAHKMNMGRKLEDVSDTGMAEIMAIQNILRTLFKLEQYNKKNIVIRADFTRLLDTQRRAADPEFASEYDELKKISKKFTKEVIFEHVNNTAEKEHIKAGNLARGVLGLPPSDGKEASVQSAVGSKSGDKKKTPGGGAKHITPRGKKKSGRNLNKGRTTD